MDESNVHVNALELINKNGVTDWNLIRPIAKLLEPTNKSQFWSYDDPDSDNGNDYVMNWGKLSIFGDKFIFKDSGKIFTWRGDVPKMITDFKFNTTHSMDAKLIIHFMYEMCFDIHTRGKSLKDRILTKKLLLIKRTLLASGLKRSERTIFLSESSIELRDRLWLIIQKKQAGKDTNGPDKETAATIDNSLEYKSITHTQHKKTIEDLIPSDKSLIFSIFQMWL